MLKIIATFLIFLFSSCATQLVKEVDLSNNLSGKAVLSTECNATCEAVIATSFTYGKRYFNSGIGPALVYEVNETKGSQTFRCPDCVGKVINAFNDSSSGTYKITVPAGETNLVVSIDDFRVRNPSKYKIAFQAVVGRTYAVLQIQKNPLGNEGDWIPIIIDTVENRVIFPFDNKRWFHR